MFSNFKNSLKSSVVCHPWVWGAVRLVDFKKASQAHMKSPVIPILHMSQLWYECPKWLSNYHLHWEFHRYSTVAGARGGLTLSQGKELGKEYGRHLAGFGSSTTTKQHWFDLSERKLRIAPAWPNWILNLNIHSFLACAIFPNAKSHSWVTVIFLTVWFLIVFIMMQFPNKGRAIGCKSSNSQV